MRPNQNEAYTLNGGKRAPIDGWGGRVVGPWETVEPWQSTWLPYYHGRIGSKGKPTTVNGRKWSPNREYYLETRTASLGSGVTTFESYNQGRLWRYIVTGPGIGFPGDYTYFPASPTNGVDWNTWNRICAELYVKAGRRQVNYGEALAESKSTFRMLVSSVQTLAKAALAARRGNFSEVARHLGVDAISFRKGTPGSSKWLAYQFGWLPLMSDIVDTSQLLQKGLQTGPQLFSAVRNLSFTEDWGNRPVSWYQKVETNTRTFRYKAKAWWKISDSTVASLSQLGLLNPLEVAWAVQPFSFVVDWFLPVSTLLEAYTARLGTTFVDGFVGYEFKSVASCSPNWESGNDKLLSSSWRLTSERMQYWRTPLSGYYVPLPYMKSPFSTSHAISAIALIRQLSR